MNSTNSSILYSSSVGGFFDEFFHGDKIPADAVRIEYAEYIGLLDAQSSGKKIIANESGLPIVIDHQFSIDEVINLLKSVVQSHLDTTAQSLGYGDMKSAVSYAEEPAVAEFQRQGRALRSWRSFCWEHCFQVFDAMQAGERKAPTSDELINELPSLEL